MELPKTARQLIESAPLAHLVTLNPDGSPHVTIVWVGIDDEGRIVSGHLGAWKKVRNVENDQRVAMSVETTHMNEIGLTEYLVINGRATATEGGAADLLQRLAYGYIGPDVKFPPFDNPPAGYVIHVEVERVGGVGPWAPPLKEAG